MTCTIDQESPEGEVAPSSKAGYLDEEAITVSASNCSSTYVLKLESYSMVENENPVHDSSGSAASYGSGYGPVTATAQNNVLVAEYGPTLVFTFETLASLSGGASVRICRQLTTNDLLEAESLVNC